MDRLDRRHASPTEWKQIERQIAEGLPTGPLALSGVFSRVLAGAEGHTVQWLHAMLVEASDPLATVQALDAHLKRQPVELRLRCNRTIEEP